MRRGERPLGQLPAVVLVGFLLLFALQIWNHHGAQREIDATYRPLQPPLGTDAYLAMAMGSEELLGYLLAIQLQLHDNQIGQHFSYNLIDYDVLLAWLNTISDMSLRTEYPLLLASRIYTQTGDLPRLRKILEFIEQRFDDNPQLHWRRLAEASVIAKHKGQDLELALRFAEKLAAQPDSVVMPRWARDFEFLLLAELNELESAIAIIQALLESQSVTDPDELYFLRERLSGFQQELFESRQTPQNQPN